MRLYYQHSRIARDGRWRGSLHPGRGRGRGRGLEEEEAQEADSFMVESRDSQSPAGEAAGEKRSNQSGAGPRIRNRWGAARGCYGIGAIEKNGKGSKVPGGEPGPACSPARVDAPLGPLPGRG